MFDMTTCTDMYAALVQDFDEFMTETHSTRRAVHCAVAAYHLREWIWKDWLSHDQSVQKAMGVSDQPSFNAWINRSCPSFPLIRELTNGSKHFIESGSFQTARVMACPFSFDQLTAGFDEGTWDGPTRYVQGSLPVGLHGQGYLILEFGRHASEQSWLPAAHLIEVVVRFWRDFFKKFLPAANLTNSRHHPF